MGAVGVEVKVLGIRFVVDRQGRPVPPGAARFRRGSSSLWGLRDVSFSVGPGEGVALIGRNSSGKTTLLRALAGVYEPDEGTVTLAGRVRPLLSAGAGLFPRLTGRESCMLLGVLAGLSRAESRQTLEEVKRRSGLGDAFEHLVSTYSPGMRARLGFTAIAQTEPQILLLDEVHQVLDREFRKLMEAQASAILEAGGIIIAAGHDHPALERVCSRAILLEGGRLAADGDFADVTEVYADGRPLATARMGRVGAGGS
jgi:ABC-type polysaccharide/polyol phosphate transport system ATPase subunit